MGLTNPIPEETRDEVLRLAREGVARNEIARRTGVSTASVSRICSGEDVAFDREQTAAAVKARVVDLKAARLELATDLLDDVTAARGRLHIADSAKDFAEVAKAVHYLTGSHVRLAAVDKDDTSGVDAAKSMLGKLATAIGVAVAESGEEGDDDAGA